jgi:hypothetical protein
MEWHFSLCGGIIAGNEKKPCRFQEKPKGYVNNARKLYNL